MSRINKNITNQVNQFLHMYLKRHTKELIVYDSLKRTVNKHLTSQQAQDFFNDQFLATTYQMTEDHKSDIVFYSQNYNVCTTLISGQALLNLPNDIKTILPSKEYRQLKLQNKYQNLIYDGYNVIINRHARPLTGLKIIRVLDRFAKDNHQYVNYKAETKHNQLLNKKQKQIKTLADENINHIIKVFDKYLEDHKNEYINNSQLRMKVNGRLKLKAARNYYFQHYIAQTYQHGQNPGIDTKYFGRHHQEALPLMTRYDILQMKDDNIQLSLEDYKKLLKQNGSYLYDVNDILLHHRVIPLTGKNIQYLVANHPNFAKYYQIRKIKKRKPKAFSADVVL